MGEDSEVTRIRGIRRRLGALKFVVSGPLRLLGGEQVGKWMEGREASSRLAGEAGRVYTGRRCKSKRHREVDFDRSSSDLGLEGGGLVGLRGVILASLPGRALTGHS